MRAIVTRALGLGASLSLLLAPPAVANHGRAETVYVAPAETMFAVPTSYVASSYVPTSYVESAYVPTFYSPSSYVVSDYYPTTTAYVVPRYRARRPLFPRRAAAYAYTPTYYVAPTATTYISPTTTTYLAPARTTYVAPVTTTLDLPVVTSSATVCEPARVTTGLPTSDPAPPAGASQRSAPVPPANDRSQGEVKISVPQGQGAEGAAGAANDNRGGAGAAADSSVDSNPPQPDEPARAKPGDVGVPAASPPAVQAEDQDGGPLPNLPADAEHIVKKPVAPSWGILKGRVLSGSTRQPEEGVSVVLTNRGRPDAFKEKTGLTDAFGRFAITVPPGDWTVQVARANGKLVAVKNITVSGGAVATEEGRDLTPGLSISR